MVPEKVINLEEITKKTSIRQLRYTDLNVDKNYQRNLDWNFIYYIAHNLNFIMFGVLLVAYRPETQKYYIVDGQHRWEAYKLFLEVYKQKRVKTLTCQVFTSSGKKEESDLFNKLQEERNSLKPYDLYRASVLAGYPEYFGLNTWLEKTGFCVVKNTSKNHNSIQFIRLLVSLWKKDSKSQKKALLFQRSFLDFNQSLDARINSGLFYLYSKGVNIDSKSKKIKQEGGKNTVLVTIKSLMASNSIYTLNKTKDRLKALGILMVANKNCRKNNRIELPGDIDV